ncbi:MAG: CheR family methyltransferase, partial [Pseudomonadota bacterium]
MVEGFVVKPELRKLVVFARQDITRDPPFTQVDMVVCRNLLIYLDSAAQQRVLEMFHFALRRDGYLFLGPSESLGSIVNDFSVVNSEYKIFTKRTTRRVPTGAYTTSPIDRAVIPETQFARGARPHRAEVGGRPIGLVRAYDALMEDYMPPSLLVTAAGEIAHTFGKAFEYLMPQTGVASLYLSDVIHPDLRVAIISALRKIQSSPENLRYAGIRVKLEQEVRTVDVIVRHLKQRASSYLLISFDQQGREARTEADVKTIRMDLPPSSGEHERISELESELQQTQDHLQSAVEDLETSNEELQATNEELMAANEELQATNEELHSVNEELFTVNREHEIKIHELMELTADVNNLLASTEIGTLFLDAALRIRKFTPAAATQFDLIDQDLGRPISHLNMRVDCPDFEEQLREVMRTGEVFEAEVEDRFGSTLLMKITCYREADESITG